jgi:hypothetical protein
MTPHSRGYFVHSSSTISYCRHNSVVTAIIVIATVFAATKAIATESPTITVVTGKLAATARIALER